MVWSTTARNIGSMIDGKMVRNAGRCSPLGGPACGPPCGPPGVPPRCPEGGGALDGEPCSLPPFIVPPTFYAATSMSHENRQGGVCQDVAGGAAEYHLAQPTLRVGALDQEIAAEGGRVIENCLPGAARARFDGDGLCRHPMHAQMKGDVFARRS